MQILPTSLETEFSVGTSSGRDSAGVSRLFSDYLESSPAEVTPSLSDSNPHAALNSSEDMFASNSPYIQADAQNSRFAPTEVRFTEEEVRKIATGLQAEGVDPAVINAVTSLAGNPMGVTAPDIMHVIAATLRPAAKVSDGDLQRISVFLNKIDPEGGLAERVTADLLAGRTLSAWQQIVFAVNAMDPAFGLDVNAEEIAALAKAMGLSAGTRDALLKSFGGADSLKLSSSGFQNLMTPAQQELGERQAQMEKFATSFEKVLSPIAQEARMRLVKEEAATGRAERSVEHSKLLIQDTVTEKGLTRTAGEDALEQAMAKAMRKTDENAKHWEFSEDAGKKQGSENEGHDGLPNGNADSGKSKTGAWDSLLSKIHYQGHASSQAIPQSMASAQPASQPAPTTSQLPNYAPHVLQQVEQGVLSAAKNGGMQRLELQLTPEHLGVVTVVLTAKNGEISALLRAERPETAAMMNQQADQLRFALEQQGLKVDRVEVQAQLQDQRGNMTWQGMEQHNAFQEQQAQTQEHFRILRLGRLHRGGSDGMDVDRNMHKGMHDARQAAEIAGRSLHVIA